MNNSLPLVARLFDIIKYINHPDFAIATDSNVDTFEKFLKERYEGDIKSFKNEEATRDKIVDELSTLRESFDRSKAILIFFSGIAGKTGSGSFIICPADIGKSTSGKSTSGITAETLVQLFNNMARARGNNITFLLDYPLPPFNWGNPSSFTVVASSCMSDREAFTNSVIKVLRSEPTGSLTVQSFADQIRAVMPQDAKIDCYGQNVDRLLFNPAGGTAHYAFIPGRAEIDGSISLLAGHAHGVQAGAIYGIYPNHVMTDQKPLGHLEVIFVKDATSSTLSSLRLDFRLPPIFYAVETQCPHETVEIFCQNNGDIAPSMSWKKAAADKANISLRILDSDVEFSWNGFAGSTRAETEPHRVGKDLIMKTIRNAARFTYHIGPSSDTSSHPLFEVKFKEVDEDSEKPKGKDLLSSAGFVELDVTERNKQRRFCLVLRNVSNHDIWPFAFRCETSRFSILPWYTPTEALASGKDLTIGCGDEDDLVFDWRPNSKPDLAYIKIFATKERTRFSFLQQYGSDIEDRLREVPFGTSGLGDRSEDAPDAPRSPAKVAGGKGTNWYSMRITIKQKYEQEKTINPLGIKGFHHFMGNLKIGR